MRTIGHILCLFLLVVVFEAYAIYDAVPLSVVVLMDLAVVAYYVRKKFAPTWALHTPR